MTNLLCSDEVRIDLNYELRFGSYGQIWRVTRKLYHVISSQFYIIFCFHYIYRSIKNEGPKPLMTKLPYIYDILIFLPLVYNWHIFRILFPVPTNWVNIEETMKNALTIHLNAVRKLTFNSELIIFIYQTWNLIWVMGVP